MKNEEPMRNINPFGLRMQPDLKARIEAAAEKKRRSLNAEIVARLESTLEIDYFFASYTRGEQDYSDAASWIPSLSDQVAELEEELREAKNNPVVLDGAEIAEQVARKIRAPEIEIITAIMALVATFPNAITDEHRQMLLSAASRLGGVESSNPTTAITITIKQLLAHMTLRERGM